MLIQPLSERPEFVAPLARATGREWAHLYPHWGEEAARRELASQGDNGLLPLTLVAVDGPIVLGTVSLIFNDLPGWEDRNPWLASLLVLPEHRGNGVATRLVRAAEEALVLRGFVEAWLFTERARPLFERLGWRFFDTADCGGHPVEVLRRDFAGTGSEP